MVTINNKKATRYEHEFDQNPEFSKNLRSWREAGTVTLKSKMQPKVKERGDVCMFVGYASNHTGIAIGCGTQKRVADMNHAMLFSYTENFPC